jgi:hypothetical protein
MQLPPYLLNQYSASMGMNKYARVEQLWENTGKMASFPAGESLLCPYLLNPQGLSKYAG